MTQVESTVDVQVKPEKTETVPDVVVKVEDTQNGNSQGPSVHQKLLRQIEYYFGDVNLPHDKFIKTELAKLEGWFPIELLLKFNKINQILEGVVEDEQEKIKQIIAALEPSELVEINETKDKIRRSPEMPLPEGTSENRTIYLKGFHKTETKLDTLIDYFKKYEGLEAVIMRYWKEKVLLADLPKKEEEKGDVDGVGKDEPDSKPLLQKYAPVTDKIGHVKRFKGSAFIVFKTEENAKAALADITTYCGNELLKMMQSEYIQMKKKEYEERQSLRKRKQDPKKEEEAADDEPETSEDDPSGIFVKLTEVPKDYTREQLKEYWYKALGDEKKFEVAFVDFQKGDVKGYFRLARENAAVEALEALKDKHSQFPVADDLFVKVSALEEEEEKKYREKVKVDRMQFKKSRTRGGRHHHHRGGGRGRKRGRF